jgi:hypothetical protein
MAAIRFPAANRAVVLLAWLCAGGLATAPRARAGEPLQDEPVIWYEDDRRDIPLPRTREPNLLWDGPNEVFVRPLGRLTHPGRAVRRVRTLFGGDQVLPAANLNALDEVPNSTWFTNRIGLFPMTPEEVARGMGEGGGPDRSGPWTVIKAKTEGVTPGFNIRDAKGVVYVIKFDAPGCLGMTITVDVICGKLLHAAGFNVPEDEAVLFRRTDLVLGEGVKFVEPDGRVRPMTDADLDLILRRVDQPKEGTWLALASRYLPGKPVGSFDWKGRRDDDANDRVDHEDRREIRGLKIFCSWLNHYDAKQGNTLDMYVEEAGRHFVKHHLIDFASTMGAGALGPVPRYGFEYTIDPIPLMTRALTVGVTEPGWRKIQRPAELQEVGYFESHYYDPAGFKGLQPNAAFANTTDRDAYWATKIITALGDEHLRAVCQQGGYQDPRAAAYMARTLAERRDKLARVYFQRLAPLDFFSCDGQAVGFHDLGEERGSFPGTHPRYHARVAAVTAGRHVVAGTGWLDQVWTTVALSQGAAADVLRSVDAAKAPFIAVECQVDRGSGFSASVTAYIARASGRVVALQR